MCMDARTKKTTNLQGGKEKNNWSFLDTELRTFLKHFSVAPLIHKLAQSAWKSLFLLATLIRYQSKKFIPADRINVRLPFFSLQNSIKCPGESDISTANSSKGCK